MSRTYPYQAIVDASGMAPYMTRYLENGLMSGGSKDTHRRRLAALRRFIVWCCERSLNQAQDITRETLHSYCRHMYYHRKADGNPLTPGSQNALLTPIKSFFQWLAKHNHILYDPTTDMVIPKKPKKLPRANWTSEDVKRILQQPDIRKDEGLRDRAILEVLHSTGIRRSEITDLAVDDIDSERLTLKVNDGKNRRDRLLPISAKAVEWVEKYKYQVRSRLLQGTDDGTLFLNRRGVRFKPGTLSARVKSYAKKAGIDKWGSCHPFRHFIGTHMLENGADIRFIQSMLGHVDLSTTQIYTHVVIEKLREVHAVTHTEK